MRAAGERFKYAAKNKKLVIPAKAGIPRLLDAAKTGGTSGFALRQKLTTLDSGFRRNDQAGGIAAKFGVSPKLTFWIPAFAGMTEEKKLHHSGESRNLPTNAAPKARKPPEGGGTPPVCIPTLERGNEENAV